MPRCSGGFLLARGDDVELVQDKTRAKVIGFQSLPAGVAIVVRLDAGAIEVALGPDKVRRLP